MLCCFNLLYLAAKVVFLRETDKTFLDKWRESSTFVRKNINILCANS